MDGTTFFLTRKNPDTVHLGLELPSSRSKSYQLLGLSNQEASSSLEFEIQQISKTFKIPRKTLLVFRTCRCPATVGQLSWTVFTKCDNSILGHSYDTGKVWVSKNISMYSNCACFFFIYSTNFKSVQHSTIVSWLVDYRITFSRPDVHLAPMLELEDVWKDCCLIWPNTYDLKPITAAYNG